MEYIEKKDFEQLSRLAPSRLHFVTDWNISKAAVHPKEIV